MKPRRRVRPAAALGALALLALSCAPRTPVFDPHRVVGELRLPLAHWSEYWRRYDPAFTLDSLRWSRADTIRVERTVALADSDRAAAASPDIAWSPDRTRAVNPNWYREWDPERKEFTYEPDAVSELLDFQTRTGSFLEFCGTSCRNEDAVWLDRERFALMGWIDSDLGDTLFAPTVTVYDLDRRTTAFGVGRAVRLTASAPGPGGMSGRIR